VSADENNPTSRWPRSSAIYDLNEFSLSLSLPLADRRPSRRVERDRPAFAGELIETFIALFTSAEILCTLHREHSQFNVLYILRLSRFARVLLRVSRRAAQPAGIPLSETGVDMLSLSLSLSRAFSLYIHLSIFYTRSSSEVSERRNSDRRISTIARNQSICQSVGDEPACSGDR